MSKTIVIDAALKTSVGNGYGHRSRLGPADESHKRHKQKSGNLIQSRHGRLLLVILLLETTLRVAVEMRKEKPHELDGTFGTRLEAFFRAGVESLLRRW